MGVFRFHRKNIVLAAFLSALCCVLMVIFPTIAMSSARKGISLWGTNVLPALLPFFICASFLQNIGVVRYLRSGAFPFVMSILSGYPMGAKVVGDLRRSGEISLAEGKRLMSFCSTSGPAFLISAVGTGMLGSAALGAVIAAAHYLGAAANGLLYRVLLGESHEDFGGEGVEHFGSIRPASRGVQESFTAAILSSFQSLGIILAYIVLFTFAIDIIHMCGGFALVPSPGVSALLKGFMEMTVGCGAVAECSSLTDEVKCVLCAAIMSWGGLSVLGQSMSMLSGAGISARYLFCTKFTHSLFSAAIAFAIVRLI